MDKRLKQQLDFVLEIDKEKNILRQTHLSGHGRRENDAEHAWHMAIMSYLLREYSNESVDIAKVMLMCLIHDIVEIDAGDTFAYDEEGRKTQKAREDAAKERIFSILPEDQKNELIALFDEFEDEAFTEDQFEVQEDDGYVSFHFTAPVTERGTLLMDSLILGLTEIEHSYNNRYLTVKVKEV